MIRRAAITGFLALGLLLAVPKTAPLYGRIVDSAQSFQRHFEQLGAGKSMSPLERFFFSLALTNTRASTSCTVCLPERT